MAMPESTGKAFPGNPRSREYAVRCDAAGRFGFSRKGRPCGTDRLAHEESGDTEMRRPEPHAAAAGSTAAELSTAAKQQLRALIPPMTPGFILRALLGVILFFCGIVFGVWLIIRFRRLDRGNGAPDALS